MKIHHLKPEDWQDLKEFFYDAYLFIDQRSLQREYEELSNLVSKGYGLTADENDQFEKLYKMFKGNQK